MMTLKDCLRLSHWPDVKADMLRLLPDMRDYIDHFHSAYRELAATAPRAGDLRITIGQYPPNGVLSFYIVGFRGECPKGYCCKFIGWDEWVGARIDAKTVGLYRHSEIVALCLWDMCFAGFSSEDIVNFRREFIHSEDALGAIFGYDEMIKDSEPDPIKYKQRSNEFNKALNLSDFDDDLCLARNPSQAFEQARFDLEVQIYCLGEIETDYDAYCEKVAQLREDFSLRWPDPRRSMPQIH